MASNAVLNSSDVAPSATLRAELKEWERAFAAENGGRKAGRNDIKQNPSIAGKYKEYGRLKSLESSSKDHSSESVKPGHHPKKRKHDSPTGPGLAEPAPTPSKTAKNTFLTPSTNRFADNHPSQFDPYDSPSVLRRLFSPSTHRTPLKAAIGPTPQRDGKTLGLFDLLSESGGSTATPSANRMASMQSAVVRTPSKRKAMDTIAEEEEEETLKPERTPASSGKRFMLSNLFATPTTLRYAAMADGEDNADAAESKNQANNGKVEEAAESGTPSFLRRSNSGRYGNAVSNGGTSPTAVRKPQPFVGKGLSALVQGLRDMEEERMDDDMDVLREVEAEQAAANVGVDDSQAQTNDTRPPPKKKGQKRTTRRVNMRPVIVPKPTRESRSRDAGSGSDGYEQGEETGVPETQQPSTGQGADAGGQFDDSDDSASLHSMSEPDLDSDLDYVEEAEANKTKTKSFAEKIKEAISSVAKPQSKSQEKQSQPAAATKEKDNKNKKPRARKINPEAHANYRSLKLRNKGTKGRFGGRFGRRN